MEQEALIPHLFRTEYSKIVVVLSKRFGLDQLKLLKTLPAILFWRPPRHGRCMAFPPIRWPGCTMSRRTRRGTGCSGRPSSGIKFPRRYERGVWEVLGVRVIPGV